MLARNGKTPTEIGKILTDERTLVDVRIDIWTHLMRGCIIELCTLT